jgi:hypothetical protein
MGMCVCKVVLPYACVLLPSHSAFALPFYCTTVAVSHLQWSGGSDNKHRIAFWFSNWRDSGVNSKGTLCPPRPFLSLWEESIACVGHYETEVGGQQPVVCIWSLQMQSGQRKGWEFQTHFHL